MQRAADDKPLVCTFLAVGVLDIAVIVVVIVAIPGGRNTVR